MSHKGKVLNFNQGAEFHYAKFEKNIDQGKYLDSLADIRAALAKEPENADYRLALAELYTEMNNFEESNMMLFELMRDGIDMDGDCVYGMGCNFLGMQDTDKAEDCFTEYLAMYPDGEYVEDAEDFIDMIEEDNEDSQDDDIPDEVYDGVDKGKALMDSGCYDEAITVMEGIAKKCPDLLFLKNNLSVAYFCVDRTDDAIRLAKEVLAEDPENTHACCNMVLFGSRGDGSDIKEYVDRIDSLTAEDTDEQIKIALTFLELHEEEKAYETLREALTETPYDRRTLFLAAASANNAGKPADALRILLDMVRIDPEDTIALYYKNLISNAREEGRTVHIDYMYQVPVAEIRDRMAYLNSVVEKGEPSIKELWTNDLRFRSMVKWGLTLADEKIKRAILQLIGTLGDRDAEYTLRRYLMNRDEPDAVKNDVFLILGAMDAKQPYPAYIAGKFIDARVGTFGSENMSANAGNKRVFERIIEGCDTMDCRDRLKPAVKLLENYISSFEKPPVMRNVDAWAAAMIVLSSDVDDGITEKTAAKALGAAEMSVKRCMAKLLKEGKWFE